MAASVLGAPLIRSLALSIKDGLRGVRHIFLSLRNRFASLAKVSPAPMRRFGQVLVHHFDRIADRVDRNTSSIVHRYLDPEISRKADIAVLSRIASLDDANASVIFAKISYDNLKTVVAYLCNNLNHEGHFFVSETLGAVAYGRAAAHFAAVNETETESETESETEIDTTTDTEQPTARSDASACVDAAHAAALCQALLRIGMVRTSTSSNAAYAPDHNTRKIAELSVFSAMLWLVIERESTPESEDELLIDCCDMALAQADTVSTALTDAATLANLISFCRESV